MKNINYGEITQWLYEKIKNEIYDDIRENEEYKIEEIKEEYRKALEVEVQNELRESLKDKVEDQLRKELKEEIRDDVYEQVYRNVEDAAIEAAIENDYQVERTRTQKETIRLLKKEAIQSLKKEQDIIDAAIQKVKEKIVGDKNKMREIIDEIKTELAKDILDTLEQDIESS